MKKIFIILLSSFLLFNLNSFAQEGGGFESYKTIYGILAIPVGDFGDDSGDDAGFAKMGFGGGLEFTKALSSPELGWATSVSFITNPLDESALQDIFGDNLETKPIFNIPILTGLKYQTEISDGMQFFGTAQLGINLIKSGTWSYNNTEIKFDMATSFGFVIGGGLIFNDKFNLGIRYYALGKPEIEAEIFIEGDSVDTFEEEIKISIFAITLGINF